MSDMKKHVSTIAAKADILAIRAAAAHSPVDAMQYAQAALSLAHAAVMMESTEKK